MTATRTAAGVTVAFLGGTGRSGSTLLSRILGNVPGCVCVGQLNYLFDQGVRADRPCSCGRPFSQCAFWQRVGEVAFGGWDWVDTARMLRLRRAVTRVRRTPRLMWPTGTFAANLREYAAVLSKVYLAVADVSGSTTVIDSAKYPSTAYFLRHLPEVDLRVVQLVRSPFGVAYSSSKHVARPDRDGAPMA